MGGDGNAGIGTATRRPSQFDSWGFFDGNIGGQGGFLIGANRQVCPTRPA
jgi:hypothetical protein